MYACKILFVELFTSGNTWSVNNLGIGILRLSHFSSLFTLNIPPTWRRVMTMTKTTHVVASQINQRSLSVVFTFFYMDIVVVFYRCSMYCVCAATYWRNKDIHSRHHTLGHA